jgi:hypothetical protein
MYHDERALNKVNQPLSVIKDGKQFFYPENLQTGKTG